MFVILYYDVNQKRCSKMLKIGRKYLLWVQNSVFEGEITKANFEKMKMEMKKVVKKEDGDSLVIYRFRKMKYFKRDVIGQDNKLDLDFI